LRAWRWVRVELADVVESARIDLENPGGILALRTAK
jgi:hypothetical protein